MNSPDLPLVTIITPVYNGARYLDALIQSVQKQDYPNIEHIIIDDGSNDGGATIDLLKQYPHLRWWSRPNRGQYATMNEGLLASQGEIVCFISADDILMTGSVAKAQAFLRIHPDSDGMYGYYGFIDFAGKELHSFHPMRHLPAKFYPYSLHISHSSFFLRKASLIQNNMVFNDDLRFVGDYSWIANILKSKLKIGRIRDKLSMIRIHELQTSKTRFYEMRKEVISVQKRLGISLFVASIFRKLLFLINLINATKMNGIRSSKAIILERFRFRSRT
jgi:glycosyltransferase involved in cell wall biosynthesis